MSKISHLYRMQMVWCLWQEELETSVGFVGFEYHLRYRGLIRGIYPPHIEDPQILHSQTYIMYKHETAYEK
jgi:hypothetical protein